MTEQEILSFINEENVRVGDTIRFRYSFGMFPQILSGKLYHKEFILGGRTINSKLGPLNLPEPINYLILYNELNGLFAVSSKYVSDLEVESRRSIKATEYSQIVNEYNIKKNDEIIIVEVDNRISKVKVFDPQLRQDEDGDFYFLLYLHGEIQMFFLQAISEIKIIKQ